MAGMQSMVINGESLKASLTSASSGSSALSRAMLKHGPRQTR